MALTKSKRIERERRYIGISILDSNLITISKLMMDRVLAEYPNKEYVNISVDKKKAIVKLEFVNCDTNGGAYKVSIYKVGHGHCAKINTSLYREMPTGRYYLTRKTKGGYLLKFND